MIFHLHKHTLFGDQFLLKGKILNFHYGNHTKGIKVQVLFGFTYVTLIPGGLQVLLDVLEFQKKRHICNGGEKGSFLE